MAREKGTGNLQLEKSGRFTVRVGINGRRFSRSTGTTDKVRAEKFLDRLLAPLGLGRERVPLAEVWRLYEISPNRRDLALSTLANKRTVWMSFAKWIERNHLEITQLADITPEAVGEYLTAFRISHSASTYNGHICILREIFRILADRAGVSNDPWANVCLRASDSISRRELTLDEVERLYAAAAKLGAHWKLLVMTGIYTGLRLGDCCRLSWDAVDLKRGIIQVIPEKTKKHAHGRPTTIPIHSELLKNLLPAQEAADAPSDDGRRYVNPIVAGYYLNSRWRLDDGLRRIFKAANITMSARVDGRRRKSVLASFHSLRHTFVSLSAKAGVPLPVVQSIVGHCSTAMTRHYYHETEDALRQAVAAIPAIGAAKPEADKEKKHTTAQGGKAKRGGGRIPDRLRRLDKYLSMGIISQSEYDATRKRLLDEI